MNISFEVYLCLGIVVFYIYDSVALLYGNDFLVVVRSGKPYIRYACDGPIVMRRYMYIPNPLTPLRGEYLASYKPVASVSENDHSWATFYALTNISERIRPWISALGFELFFITPYVAFVYGSGPELLSLFISIYLTVIALFLSIYNHRDCLASLGANYWMMFLEGILCPPFALNIERKMGRLSCCYSYHDVVGYFFGDDELEKVLEAIKVKMSRDKTSLEENE